MKRAHWRADGVVGQRPGYSRLCCRIREGLGTIGLDRRPQRTDPTGIPTETTRATTSRHHRPWEVLGVVPFGRARSNEELGRLLGVQVFLNGCAGRRPARVEEEQDLIVLN